MSRAERLLELMQALRRRRRPVAGAALAEELGVSLRTLYRDVAALQRQGARIDGEAGFGYVLRPGFTLPPLMFSAEEIEALALGARWVAAQADGALAAGATDALAKIAAVVPQDRADLVDYPTLIAAPGRQAKVAEAQLPLIRRALREERKLDLTYVDAGGARTRRLVWPVALGYFDEVRVLAAWCESRGAFRHFRADRIGEVALTQTPLPRSRRALLRAWRQAEGLSD